MPPTQILLITLACINLLTFALTAYDNERESIEDPQYGVLRPYYKSWGLKESIGVEWEELPTRPCTEAELHINNKTDPNSKFFKPHKNSVADL